MPSFAVGGVNHLRGSADDLHNTEPLCYIFIVHSGVGLKQAARSL